jgi:hypothetical protein
VTVKDVPSSLRTPGDAMTTGDEGDGGMRRAAANSVLLDRGTADLLAKDELEAAVTSGWGPDGTDSEWAFIAALERTR